MESNFKKIQQDYQNKISSAQDLKELDQIFLSLFGRNGELDQLPKQFKQLSKNELKKVGPLFNQVKQELEKAIGNRRQEVREQIYQSLENEKFTLQPERLKARVGHLHPLTKFENEIVKLFSKLGFKLFQAPQIDTDYYNFEVLNIPKEHPARDLWDTFYLEDRRLKMEGGKLLLRTHTSNAQVRIMKSRKPPIRMMVLDRCFRYENTDARHEHTFDQFEIVYVDKNVSMANFQYLSEYFLKSVLKKDVKVRLRPKYYPFTEPSFGIDGQCPFCNGKGCKVCGGIGWLELGGGGMIHPTVLKNSGIDPKVYSGIAWGPGLQRILMIKHGIEDIRLFLSGDLNFLEKF